ncbi:MAG: hypothetical protein K6E85_01125 [Lachnospiraceae bacterium]|nr:hypothetical protein [Lachnospiraceae bacterium]
MSVDNQYIPEKYGSIITSTEIKPSISLNHIKRALIKYYVEDQKYEKVTLSENHIVEVNGKGKIHYRITTYRENSKTPWYSISPEKLAQLSKECDEICCLFFKEGEKDDIDVYYKVWTIDEIIDETGEPKDPWTLQTTGRRLYRWTARSISDMDTFNTSIKKSAL